MTKQVGFIGLGTLGRPMAERLLGAGFELTVYNRTVEKTQPLVERGARRAAAPCDVAAACDVIITMVSDDRALHEVACGEQGLYAKRVESKVHVDMSTISPALSQQLTSLAQTQGFCFIHAPVLGSRPQASDGTLLIFVGGSPQAWPQTDEIFRALGNRIWRFPDVVQATYLKLICNQFIASMIVTLGQGLVLGQKAGIPIETILDVLAASALNSPMYQSKARMIAQRQFSQANFYVQHMLKDIELILQAARELGVALPSLAAARELFVAAEAAGYSREDYSAAIKVLEEMARTRIGSGSALPETI
ncbi:MAG: NAD(P)-dependent oxidoreductase [Acidobacteriota bacterium]|nr:NAD(P)-dependent oxidoreductase [Blastocatellia bacterium]MDW8239340.1 NAD(P)-dependent oxidoreductase [Acidobacteriota bacterium]